MVAETQATRKHQPPRYTYASLADLARAVAALCRAAEREITPFATPIDEYDHGSIAAVHAADSVRRAGQLAQVLVGNLAAMTGTPEWAPPLGWLPFQPDSEVAVCCTCLAGEELERDGHPCPVCTLPLTPQPAVAR